MTDTQNDQERAGTAPSQAPQHPVYLYASAGIAEHEGRVPVWLWLVVVSLLVWGLYYLVTYWNAPIVQ